MQHVRVAIIDDEVVVCRRLSLALSKEGMEVEAFTNGHPYLERMREAPFDVVFCDLNLPDTNGMEVLTRSKAFRNETEVIIITGYGSIDGAVEAIKEGAYHYVAKPLKLNEIRSLCRSALARAGMCRENPLLCGSLKGSDDLGAIGLSMIVGKSPAVMKIFSMVQKIAPVDCNILLQGASGTGKALVARAIHNYLVPGKTILSSFLIGGFTDELIEQRAFRLRKSALKGATAAKIGLLNLPRRVRYFSTKSARCR